MRNARLNFVDETFGEEVECLIIWDDEEFITITIQNESIYIKKYKDIKEFIKEIVDNENIKLSSEIINFSRKEFDVKVNNIIFKLLKDKVITTNYMESIKKRIAKAIYFAKDLLGSATVDYSTYECQSCLVIKNV